MRDTFVAIGLDECESYAVEKPQDRRHFSAADVKIYPLEMQTAGKELFLWNVEQLDDCSWRGGWWLLDVETSGLDPLEDDMIALRLAYMENYHIKEERELLVRPQKTLRPEIEKLTGISNEALRQAIPLAEALQALERLIPAAPLVVWNERFDIPFLRSAFRLCDREFTLPSLLLGRLTACVLGSSRVMRPQEALETAGLSSSGEVHNRYLSQLHALAEMCFQQMESRCGIRSVEGLLAVCGANDAP